MMLHSPKVSVLMLTYNHRQFIAQALESALAQECDFDFEIVIGNDASTDGTSEILQCFAARYSSQIYLCSAPRNRGMIQNFATALAHCRGDYVALLEGDDFWSHGQKLQIQADYLDQHPGCVLSFHPVTILGGNQDQQIFPNLMSHFLNAEHLVNENVIPTCSVMFRRSVLPTLPAWFDGLPVLDWPLYVQITLAGPAEALPQAMGTYRVHSTGTWSQASLRERYLKGTEVLLRFARCLPSQYLGCVDQILSEYLKALVWRNEVERKTGPLPRGNIFWRFARRCHFKSLAVFLRWQVKMLLQPLARKLVRITGAQTSRAPKSVPR